MIPWNIDRRPVPSGISVDTLCPAQVGTFTRTKVEGNPTNGGSAYAHYAAGAAAIFVELAITTGARDAHAILDTANGEIGGTVVKGEPGFLTTPDGSFFAWTRGGYYWSAHAKGGPQDLDAFMRAFPF